MIYKVPLEKIKDNPYQGRAAADYQVDDLMQSIVELRPAREETLGLLQVPIGRLVNGSQPFNATIIGVADALQRPNIHVQLAFGHRRLRAFHNLAQSQPEYACMPVDIQELTAFQMAAIAWRENEDRQEVNDIEKAHMIEIALKNLDLGQKEIAREWGVTQGTISNLLRLLTLPQKIQDLVANGTITAKHGRTLASLVGIASLESMLDLVYDVGEVRSTRDLADAVKQYVNVYTRALKDVPFPLDWVPENDLPACLGCKHNVIVLKQSRCVKPACQNAKKAQWLIERDGPERLAVGFNPQDWGQSEPSTWDRCNYCKRRPSVVPGIWRRDQTRYVTPWYACPECWRRAGVSLDSIENSEPESPHTVTTTIMPAIPEPAVTNSPPAIPEPAVTNSPPVIPEPAATNSPLVIPAPITTVVSTTPDPDIVLVVRIKEPNGGQDPDWHVIASIGRDGQGPSDMRFFSDLEHVQSIISDLLHSYLGLKGGRKNEEV
ncbi:MAG: ParB/RepB/Spo0J family partition protein [Anaerolineae bacterium]|nr:ParB/RepB/Spo0J family partition protein [Anaerolineae bacterium]